MQVLVLYFSKGGNTRRLAEFIADGIRSVDGVAPVLKTTAEVTKEDFVGAAGIIAADLKRVFDDYVGVRKKMENKVGAAFATSGDPTGGKETTIFSIIQCLLIYGMIVVGDPMDATGHYGVACVGAPDDKAADNARKLGRRVAELCRKLG